LDSSNFSFAVSKAFCAHICASLAAILFAPRIWHILLDWVNGFLAKHWTVRDFAVSAMWRADAVTAWEIGIWQRKESMSMKAQGNFLRVWKLCTQSFICFVQILSILLIHTFTDIYKPKTKRVNQFANVIGFNASVMPGHLICDNDTTF
jgi:uncharacterized protein YqfB (UPF0267 family)